MYVICLHEKVLRIEKEFRTSLGVHPESYWTGKGCSFPGEKAAGA